MPGTRPYEDLLAWYRSARLKPGQSVLPSRQIRDLTVIELLGDLLLVFAVDSDGAIGPKPDDVVKTTGYACGRFGTRVPLMEILACGAQPLAAFDALAVERETIGEEIIRGVRDELQSVGLPPGFPLSGSTEDNVPTRQTGMGVVILGMVEKAHFRPGNAVRGDVIFSVGTPKSGPADEVRLDDPGIASAKVVADVAAIPGIHDILPVGSRGLLFEATELARSAGLAFVPAEPAPVDMRKSAGPSTCFIVAGPASLGAELPRSTTAPVHLIGALA